jgi:uncharacterized protein
MDNVEFEWDNEKAVTNLRKHGVSFEEGTTVFNDPMIATIFDPDHSEDEERYISIGTSVQGHLLVVVHAEREGRIRLISCRKATQMLKEKPMKTTKKKQDNDMRAEYDFSEAERGKFYRPLDKGYKVRVHQSDGTVIVNHYTLAEGTVLLAPDVREYFSDSQSVNEALRSLIQLKEKVPARKYSAHKSGTHQVAEKRK